MNSQLPSESAENTRQIDIDVTIDFEQLRELEAARHRAEEAASRSAAECNALLANGYRLSPGRIFLRRRVAGA